MNGIIAKIKDSNWQPIAIGFGVGVVLIILTKKMNWLGTN